MSILVDFIFNKEFWLSENCDWPPNVESAPHAQDVFVYPFFIAICLYFIRIAFEK